MSVDASKREYTIKVPDVGTRVRPLVLELLRGHGINAQDAEEASVRITAEIDRSFAKAIVLKIPDKMWKQKLLDETMHGVLLWVELWARRCWEEMLRRAVEYAMRKELAARGIESAFFAKEL
jgi:hypothetical protein